MTNLPLIEPLPDEHLASMLIREKLLMGYKRDQSVRKVTGAVSTRVKPQDISNGVVSDLARYFSVGSHIEECRLIQEHSICALWWASVGCFDRVRHATSETSAEILVGLEHQGDRHLSFDKSWKLCPRCVQKQLDEVYCSYWKVSHQLPGMSICAEHNTALLTSDRLKVLDPLLLPEEVLRSMELDVATNVDDEWCIFILKCFRELQTGNYFGRDLLEKVKFLLEVPVRLKSSGKKEIRSLLLNMECSLSVHFLAHFFSFYSKEYGDRRVRPNFLWSLLSPDSKKLRHPVYLLLVLYYLNKTPSELMGVAGHDDLAGSVTQGNNF